MKQDKRTNSHPFIYQGILLVVVLVAAGLRFAKIDVQSFWNDEGNTARLVERSISLILSGAAGDVHPPGYYLLLWAWRGLTGETEFALRSYSALCSVITVALTAATVQHLIRGWKAKSWILGLPALLFITLHPLSVYYSQEARMYAQLGLAAASLLWAAVNFHEVLMQPPASTSKRQRVTAFILLAGTVGLGLYTHYAFVFALFSLSCAYVLYWLLHNDRDWRVLVAWLVALLVGGLAFLPWVPVALRASGWRPPDLGSANVVQSLVRTLVIGVTLPEYEVVYILPVVMLLSLLIVFKLPRAPFGSWASFAMAFLPLLMIAGLGIYRPAYLKFLMVSISPFAVCLTTLTSGWLAGDQNKYLIAGLIVTLILVITLAQMRALQHLYKDPAFARDDYRSIAHYIESEAGTADAVLLNAPNQWEVFTYYYRRSLPVYTVPYRPTAQEASGWVEGIVVKHPQLFVLYWGETEADPERFIELELAKQAFKASEMWVTSVRLTRYGTAQTSLSPQDIAGVAFGTNIQLSGYYLPEAPVNPGEILPLTLVWSALTTPAERYKVFIHLVNDAGTLIAQTDAEPVGGFYLTNQWLAGEEVSDNYGVLLPDAIYPGQYSLLVGMYDFSGQRLLVARDGQVVGDALRLDTISVESRQ